MSLESLLAKIEEDGREEGRKAVEAAEEEAARLTAEGREETLRAAEKIRSSLRERGERERIRVTSEALAEGRAAFLSAQDRLFEEAFTEALRSFEGLPEDRYRAWLKRIVVENASGGEEQIVAAPYDRRLLEGGLLEEIRAALPEKESGAALTLAEEEGDFSRGVILKAANYINNLSLETLMREARDRNEEKVLKILFGEVDARDAIK